MTKVFVLCSGQEDNIGDVVLRRKMLTDLREFGELHIFLDDASPDFRDALELAQADVVYSDRTRWRRELWQSIRRRDAWLVDKPGELITSRRRLLALARLTIAALAIRAQKGAVLRLGLGQRAPHRGFALAYRPFLATANVLAWRDPESMQAFGIGEVMPDWGFGEVALAAPGTRSRLAISYRSDRAQLSDDAVAGITSAATALGLSPIVVTQVGRDEERSRSLAARLGCELVGWPEGVTHREQERRLREIYAESAVVLSDRLHVLIVGMTEGAIPLGLTEHTESKIQRHFDAVGLSGVSVQVPTGDELAAERAIIDAARREQEVRTALQESNSRLASLIARIRSATRSNKSLAHG
ncbi:hypothetical protein LQ938_02890 [Microbacterium sp. cx-55]|uniref:polysaccharide pyruvyl transferase family protein n=1 Tax=Microbacterium sp. cx-55 TaxID=2875948 RepID=UPI001CBDDF4C|nr:hypothetical protein [Microbacterium sp. cx-55]MBZ4486835.1 hypothetical protein [Microbacterium sp. cx-55]UGB35764.1 hypothetical protein LQ938_02890 [Microbacterium sp. cx-55]